MGPDLVKKKPFFKPGRSGLCWRDYGFLFGKVCWHTLVGLIVCLDEIKTKN